MQRLVNGIREADIPDILLFGGVAVPPEDEPKLRAAIEAVKAKFGDSRLPVKWNFKDLKQYYEKQNQLELYQQYLKTSKEWRWEIFEAAKEFKFTIIVACVESYSVKREEIKDRKLALSQYVFSNGLMRLGLHALECKPARVQVILDWPDKGESKPYDLEYVSAYSKGTTFDGSVEFHCGPLEKLGFLDSATFANMHHNTLLQFADLTVGATREFIECAYGKKDSAFGVDIIKSVSKHLRGAPDKVFGRGISVASGNAKLKTSLKEFLSKTVQA
jgi:hypothetical protein